MNLNDQIYMRPRLSDEQKVPCTVRTGDAQAVILGYRSTLSWHVALRFRAQPLARVPWNLSCNQTAATRWPGGHLGDSECADLPWQLSSLGSVPWRAYKPPSRYPSLARVIFLIVSNGSTPGPSKRLPEGPPGACS